MHNATFENNKKEKIMKNLTVDQKEQLECLVDLLEQKTNTFQLRTPSNYQFVSCNCNEQEAIDELKDMLLNNKVSQKIMNYINRQISIDRYLNA